MQLIFQMTGIAYFLAGLNLLDKWYILAAIVTFIIGKYIIQAMYFILHKQFEYQKQEVKGNSRPNLIKSLANFESSRQKKDPAKIALDSYKNKIDSALTKRINPEG